MHIRTYIYNRQSARRSIVCQPQAGLLFTAHMPTLVYISLLTCSPPLLACLCPWRPQQQGHLLRNRHHHHRPPSPALPSCSKSASPPSSSSSLLPPSPCAPSAQCPAAWPSNRFLIS